jgi:hypothetical protein
LGLGVFLISIAVTIFSIWLFVKVRFLTIIPFAIIAAIPLASSNISGLLSLCIIPISAGIAGGICFNKGKDFTFFLNISLVVFVTLFTVEYHSLRLFKGDDIIDNGAKQILEMMEKSKSELSDIVNERKISENEMKKIQEQLDLSISVLKDKKWIQLARDMIPFSVFLYGIIIFGFSFLILKKFILREAGRNVRGLEFYKLNDYLIFIFIFSWAAFILSNSEKFPLFAIVILNVALILSGLYIVQAIGVIKSFVIKKGIPPIVIPIILVTLFTFGLGTIIFTTTFLLGIGTLDIWADFRKLNPSEIS